MPERAAPVVERYDRLHPRAAIVDGVRVLEKLRAAPEQSLERLPGSNFNAISLPASLGGGFVFYSELDSEAVFWRADAWTSELVPLTRLPERVDHVQVGFGRIYARLADSGDTVAFDPKTGQSVTLGPLPPSPSYFDFLFWDDWFAVVHTDARGVLATFDGGATWHSTGVSDEDATLAGEPGGVLVSTSERRDLLAPDGTWTSEYEGAPAELEGSVSAPIPSLGRNPLELAVRHGMPVAANHAIVGNLGHVGLVDLTTGEVRETRRDQYPGSEPCQALALGDGAGLLCLLTSGGTALYVVASDLSLRPHVTWKTQVEMWSSGDGHLVAKGSCPTEIAASAPSTTSYCIVAGRRSPQPLHVPGATVDERVAVLNDGRVVVLTPPRTNTDGTLRFTQAAGGILVPRAAQRMKFAEGTAERVKTLVETGLWLSDGGQLPDGDVGFWVATPNRVLGVRVALDGTLSVSQRTEADLRRTHLSGGRALELSAGETAWQSVNYGQTWEEVVVPRGLTAASTRDLREVVGCSTVGCSFGSWLRVGYELPSVVPKEAEVPELLKFRPSAYSQWGLTCYPTGSSEGARLGSGQSTADQGRGRPRHGTSSGFIGSTLATSTTSDVGNSANRPFLGVPSPTVPPNNYAFDMGADAAQQFRSYAWGLDGSQWPSSGAWVTRVADRFSVAGLWSTAPTRAPWPNLLTAAQLFGADRANRYSSSWQLSLDPSERGGVLRITTTGTTELHFIEEGSATVSIGNTSFGPISGVVKVQKSWYFGTQEGNRFHVHRVRNGAVEDFADLPIGDPVAALLTRNTRGTAIGLVLRAPAGTWHVYPISDSGAAEEPLVLSRDQLNTEWPRCADDELGYYVVGALPLSRFTPNDGTDLITFEGVPSDWNAEAVTARTIVSASTHCVDAMAARLASNRETVVLSRRIPPKAGTIPLTITDRLNDVRHGFQCLP